MVLDHKYNNKGDVGYLAQWPDGSQKWIQQPKGYCFEWLELIKTYWKNDLKDKEPPTWDDPDSYL